MFQRFGPAGPSAKTVSGLGGGHGMPKSQRGRWPWTETQKSHRGLHGLGLI